MPRPDPNLTGYENFRDAILEMLACNAKPRPVSLHLKSLCAVNTIGTQVWHPDRHRHLLFADVSPAPDHLAKTSPDRGIMALNLSPNHISLRLEFSTFETDPAAIRHAPNPQTPCLIFSCP